MTQSARRWWILLEIELKSLRSNWAWVLGLALLYPMSLLSFLKLSGAASPAAAARILAGGIVFAVAMNSALALGQELATMRESGSFDFYAGLPATPSEVVAAILTRAILLSLPSAAGVALLGSRFLGTSLPSLLLAFPFLLLTCASLAGAGALLGFYAPSSRAANTISQAAYMLVVFVSPMLFRADALPRAARAVAFALPTTYAADALETLISGIPRGLGLRWDAAALMGFALLSYAVLRGRLRWTLD